METEGWPHAKLFSDRGISGFQATEPGILRVSRAFLDSAMKLVLSAQNAETAAPALSAMLIYILMAGILAVRPRGLFAPKGR